jgi:hypothetical protein
VTQKSQFNQLDLLSKILLLNENDMNKTNQTSPQTVMDYMLEVLGSIEILDIDKEMASIVSEMVTTGFQENVDATSVKNKIEQTLVAHGYKLEIREHKIYSK